MEKIIEKTNLLNSSENTHWEGKAYSQNSSYQYHVSMNELNAHSFHGNEDVLDIGCGDGKITYEIANKIPNGHILGIDNALSMISLAQQTHVRKNLSFQLMNVEKLQFEQKFDFVMSMFCLQWVNDKLAAFRNIYNCLKLGGRALLVIPRVNEELYLLKEEIAKEKYWQAYFVDYQNVLQSSKTALYEEYAKESGLALETSDEEIIPATFNNVIELAGFLAAITSHLSRLPDAKLKSAFIEQLTQKYLTMHPAKTDGSCAINFKIVKLRGLKLK